MLKNSLSFSRFCILFSLVCIFVSFNTYQVTHANSEIAVPFSSSLTQASMVVTLQFDGSPEVRQKFFLDLGSDSIEKATNCTASDEWAINVQITCQYFPEQNWVSVTAVNDVSTNLPLEVSVTVTDITHAPVPVP